MVEEFIKKFNKIFDIELQKPKVKIFNSRKEINDYLHKETESWLVGWSDDQTIYILSEDKFESNSSHSKSDFKKVLAHELLHQYFFKMTGNNKPAWLNEGFCLYFAKQKKWQPTEEEKSQLDKYFDNWDKDGYHVAYYWVSYLITNFGLGVFIFFLKKIELVSENRKTYKENFRKLFVEIFGFYPDRDASI